MNFTTGHIFYDIWTLKWTTCELTVRNCYSGRKELVEDGDDLYYTLAIL